MTLMDTSIGIISWNSNHIRIHLLIGFYVSSNYLASFGGCQKNRCIITAELARGNNKRGWPDANPLLMMDAR
jgi:hypothetical protein